MKNALICVNLKKDKSCEIVREVSEILHSTGITPLIPTEFKPSCYNQFGHFDTLENHLKIANCVITIGGDGTILRWGKKASKFGLPLLGINTGRLGFMATLEHDELYKLSNLKTGDFSISRRMMIDVNISLNNSHRNLTALNDVVLFKDTHSKIPEFSVVVNGNEVSNIRADGIIFSTATGSTAYALSAGGPIIQPEMECIQFTPLSAHTLFARPMVFSGDNVIEVYFKPYVDEQVFAIVDGGESIPIKALDKVLLTKSCSSLDIIDLEGNSFYKSIHDKLMKPLK